MTNKDQYLKINPEWEYLVYPLRPKEKQQLYERIDKYGCVETIKIWNLYVLTDFELFEYCKQNNIPFRTENVYAKGIEEALLWICKHELDSKKCIPEEMKKYLIGKRYLLERVLGAHAYQEAKKVINKNQRYKQKIGETKYDETATTTRQRIGNDYHINFMTVRKYGIFAEKIDMLREVSPELAKEILTGNIRISHENLEAIVNLSPAEIRKASSKILSDHKSNKNYSIPREILFQTPGFDSKTTIPSSVGAIKNMPQYDPDAEISSLSYTIPTWVSTMQRVGVVADIGKVSPAAKARLRKELIVLYKVVYDMIELVKEHNDGK